MLLLPYGILLLGVTAKTKDSSSEDPTKATQANRPYGKGERIEEFFNFRKPHASFSGNLSRARNGENIHFPFNKPAILSIGEKAPQESLMEQPLQSLPHQMTYLEALNRGRPDLIPTPVPQQLNWARDNPNMNLPVLSQGEKPLCWATSAGGAISLSYIRSHSSIVMRVSDKQLADCTYTTLPEEGGRAADALEYVLHNRVYLWNSYPGGEWNGVPEPCRTGSVPPTFNLTDYAYVPYREISMERMKRLLWVHGSLVVPWRIGPSFLTFKGEGIFDGKDCAGLPNHELILIGFGNENGKDYWIVKNSWGTSWGWKGYAKILSDQNVCGIENSLLIPLYR